MEAEERLDTLPKLLRDNYQRHPNKEALRAKDRGIWKSFTWKDYYGNVKYFCLGLKSLGLKPGDKISILGENKPQWYYAELAVQAAGGAAVGIFTDCVPDEVKFYVEHSDSVFVIAHDQEQVDKMLKIKDQLPLLKNIIYWEDKGLWNYKDAMLLSFDEVIEKGRKYEALEPLFFDESIDRGKSDDIAVICYTSGTTGIPKGAMLDQKFLVEGARTWGLLDEWVGKGYSYLSFIPGAWSVEQVIGIAGSLFADMTVNFPEKPETVQENLREIGPNLLFYGARLWEQVNRTIQAKMLDSSLPRRLIYKICLPIGLKVADLRSEKKEVNLLWRILYALAYQAIFRQLRDRLGLSNVKVVYSAGAAVSPEIIRYFLALGIEIKLFYGATELGAISIPRKGEIRPDTSGPIVPWAEAKLSEDGEILIKSKYMYAGYYKNSGATKAKFNDGWFQTGDFGYIDDDHQLIVIDRMDDLKELAGGKKFSPQYTEVRLRFSPFIKDVMVVGGESREYVTALINIDMENVGRYAEQNRISYTTFSDLSQKPEIIELIHKEILRVNRTLPDHARIKKFVNIYKELDADEAELTRTRKLRRSFVEDRYSDLIGMLYGEKEEYAVEASVTYRDGRTGILKTTIKVKQVLEERR
jgi:long-chain acyl-CoA synthetase